MSGRVRIWDFCLIAVLLFLCLIPWLFPQSQGRSATVSVNGETVAILPLDRDTVFVLENGARVVVENRAVRIENASCPDLLCESMGPVSLAGESVLCLPHKISVVLSGEEVDAIVG